MFALGNERDRFSSRVEGYFAEWIDALAEALARTGRDAAGARALAEEVVGGIQGALVLARALDRPGVFADALARLRQRVE
jgi:pyrroline-5-carboxylate reductase